MISRIVVLCRKRQACRVRYTDPYWVRFYPLFGVNDQFWHVQYVNVHQILHLERIDGGVNRKM